MKSMTGYGSSRFSSDEYDLEIGIKSVNGRFLDFRFHMPREYSAIEVDLKKFLSSFFKRGTVDIYIQKRLGPSSNQVSVMTNIGLAKKWLKSYREIAKELKLDSEDEMEAIVQVPEIIHIEEIKKMNTKEKKAVLDCLSEAAEGCIQQRTSEGEFLRKEVNSQLKKLGDLVAQVEKIREKANTELEKKMLDRISNYDLKEVVDPNRIAQEVVMQIDRSDINEEVTRLNEHIAACSKLLKDDKKNHGKKLDFFAQELLREVNTIGSKSQISKLTQLVVEAKTIVERIREQVQNIE